MCTCTNTNDPTGPISNQLVQQASTLSNKTALPPFKKKEKKKEEIYERQLWYIDHRAGLPSGRIYTPPQPSGPAPCACSKGHCKEDFHTGLSCVQ